MCTHVHYMSCMCVVHVMCTHDMNVCMNVLYMMFQPWYMHSTNYFSEGHVPNFVLLFSAAPS